MFIFRRESAILILLIYVDDIAICGSSKMFGSEFIISMKSEYTMKDLGSLCYFLDVEIVHNSNGVLLSQRKYIQDLLHKFGLAEVKPVQTHLYNKLEWHSDTTPLLDDHSLYLQMVGSL